MIQENIFVVLMILKHRHGLQLHVIINKIREIKYLI
jgi:hypothetical protein